MSQNRSTTVATVAVTVGITLAAVRAVQGVRSWVDEKLVEIDTMLCRFDEEEDEDEPAEPEDVEDATPPCVCGSTEHKAERIAWMTTNALLSREGAGEVGNPVIPVVADFTFAESDPHAVQMTVTLAPQIAHLHPEKSAITWGYARDLLDTALSRDDSLTVGDGDVSCAYDPDSDVLHMFLDGDSGRALLEVEGEPLRVFLASSFGIADGDVEQEVDDEEIARLLGEN